MASLHPAGHNHALRNYLRFPMISLHFDSKEVTSWNSLSGTQEPKIYEITLNNLSFWGQFLSNMYTALLGSNRDQKITCKQTAKINHKPI